MLRVGVVALGAIGLEHLDNYRGMPGVQVTAVADADRALAEKVAAQCGAQAFGSCEELLAAGVVDAISLCTPDHLHHADAVRTIDAGVHLLLEKPIATTVDEAEDLVRRAEASDVVVMPGHTLRFANQYLKARELVASGTVGQVVHGSLRRNNKLSVAERVKGRIPVTFFLGIHDIDALMWIVGERVTQVQAFASGPRTPEGGQPLAVEANLRLASGGVIGLEAAWCLPEDYPTVIDARLRLVGTEGEVRIDIHDFGMSAFSGAYSFPIPGGSVYGAPEGMLYQECATFLRAVEGDIAVPVSMRDAADAVRVAVAVEEAVATGQTQEVVY